MQIFLLWSFFKSFPMVLRPFSVIFTELGQNASCYDLPEDACTQCKTKPGLVAESFISSSPPLISLQWYSSTFHRQLCSYWSYSVGGCHFRCLTLSKPNLCQSQQQPVSSGGWKRQTAVIIDEIEHTGFDSELPILCVFCVKKLGLVSEWGLLGPWWLEPLRGWGWLGWTLRWAALTTL